MNVKIGDYCTIAEDVNFGNNVVVYGHANLYGCSIGDNCKIGMFVEIQSGAIIGNGVRIQSHSFICSNIIIEDDVFIGHNVNFVNDRYPTVKKAEMKSWKCESSRVCRGASIGTGTTILCGVEIGENALVGAGSVVTHNVPPYTIVAGVPARVIRTIKIEEL